MRKQVGSGPLSSIQLPLAIAAVAGSTHSIKALLQAGVCPIQVDCHGNSVVHSMIAYLHYHSDMEENIISKFQLLTDTLSVDVMTVILHHENSFGLRPIEFAAQHGQGSMVLAIMNTPGVYLAKQEKYGLTTYKWYNIGEYEGTGNTTRCRKSPLSLMTYVDSTIAKTSGYRKYVYSDVIQNWYQKKFLMNLPLIILWFLLRALFVGAYILLSLDMGIFEHLETNPDKCMPEKALKLSPSVRFGIITFIVAQSCFSVLFDITDGLLLLLSKALHPLYHMISGRKELLTQVALYRLCYFSFSFFIVICSPAMYGLRSEFSSYLVDYSRVVTPFVATWSLLYFMQLIPKIGFSISSIYGMVSNLLVFSLMYVLMIIPFVQAFYTFINSNTMQGCIPGFSDLFQSFYSMFLIMLNLISLPGFNIEKIELLYLTHIIYTFGISILLINFFIAVMTDTMGNISQNRVLILCIQRASVAFSVEHYVKWCLKPVYNFMIKKLFVVEEGKILLIDSTDAVA